MTVLCLLRLLKNTLENTLEFTLTLNYEVNNVTNWLTSNRICINADKTNYMIFSYRKQIHLTNIKTGSATREETNNMKFLGIIVEKTSHIQKSCRRDSLKYI